MRGGELRHRLVFMRPVEGEPDAVNARTPGYAPDFTVWGEVLDLSGTELFRAQQVASEVTTAVTIRHRAGITATHRIQHGQRSLELVHPPLDDEGRRRRMRLLCKEAA